MTGLGVSALALGASTFASSMKWLLPAVLIGMGVMLLVTRPENGSAGKHGPGHQVGAERGEDGEVEQAGGRHHR